MEEDLKRLLIDSGIYSCYVFDGGIIVHPNEELGSYFKALLDDDNKKISYFFMKDINDLRKFIVDLRMKRNHFTIEINMGKIDKVLRSKKHITRYVVMNSGIDRMDFRLPDDLEGFLEHIVDRNVAILE